MKWAAIPVFLVVLVGPVPGASAQTDSFEGVEVGTIEAERSSPLGTWRTNGHAEISRHRASTGRQALRLFGGERREVVLVLPHPRDAGILGFAAERWTRRSPFVFTVEARVAGSWQTVFEDDGAAITIGGYNARVERRIEGPFDALRLVCTSPEGGGILLDDFAVEPLRPMRIVSVTTEQPILPVLIGNTVNPIARVRIVTEGSLDPIAVTGIRWTLASRQQLRDIRSVTAGAGPESLDWRNPNACLDAEGRLGEAAPAAPTVLTSGRIPLARGDTFVWLSASLTGAADLDGWVDAGCESVTFSNGAVHTPTTTAPSGRQRFGVAVRNAGDDGVAAYRIPGIITTARGTLIAVYDIRHRGWGDLPGDIDVGMSRSIDGGATWEPMRTILDMGDDEAWRYDGVGDPAILHDPATGTTWVAATWSHGDRSWNGSGPGLEPHETGQLLLTRSSDDGRTWSAPINITRQVKDPAWAFVLQSPGRGIAMADGTLVFPAQFQAPPDQGRVPHSTIMYSRDRGETWRIGRGAKTNTTECQVVELEPGTLMLNMRDNRGGARSVYVTRDMGQTWTAHPSSRGALVEPTCNAGLIRTGATDDPRKPWLAFVNPNVTRGPRRHMTLKLSLDGGMTWPTSRHLLLDEGRSAGYPGLTMLDEETIGVFYEGSRANMTFQRIPLSDVLERDTVADD
ncbi:MAG: exo-alpha-sialidase [Planctomycetota bacterium]|jgi:sialidase-1